MKKRLLDQTHLKIMLTYLSLIITSVNIDVVHGDSTSQQIQHDENFKIQHHERLKFALESESNIHRHPGSATSARDNYPGEKTLSFSAFGKDFDIQLKPNRKVFSKLPQRQRAELEKSITVFRGALTGNDQSWVRLSISDNNLSGVIWDGDEMYIIDQSKNLKSVLSEQQSNEDYPLIYRLSDAKGAGGNCAVDKSTRPINEYSTLIDELKSRVNTLPQANLRLDIAVIADTQFVANNSNPDAAVIARMNVVDGIYSEQVGVELNITEIRKLQNNGGLSSTSPGTLLNQLSNFSDSPGFNNPGLAHLFTGRDLNGGTIGIAYLDSLCSDRFGVGISQINRNGTAGALTVAHEIGHNFGAPHDNQSGSPCGNSPGGFIMNPVLNGSDQFSQCSLQQMQPAIQNANCITEIDSTPVADIRISLPQNPIRSTINEITNFPIDIQNDGNATANNLSVTVIVPAEISIQSATSSSANCTIGENEINCTLDTLGGSQSTTINIEIESQQTGRFISNIDVTADNDSNPSNNQAEVEIIFRDQPDEGFFQAHFDTDSEGFDFIDDAFRNTNQPNYAFGQFSAGGGFSGGGLRILLGGRDNADITNMSGGWSRSFNLDSDSNISLSFRIRLTQARNYEADEFSEALLSIDGNLVQQGASDALITIEGDGNGGPTLSSDWRLFTIDLGNISAGSHTLTIGGYNNKKTFRNEITEILIDDVILSGSITPDDNNPPDDNTPTSQCPAGARFENVGGERNFCWFENLNAPQGAQPYCHFFDRHQLIGYYFDINLDHRCPVHARAASNGRTLDFCLFENLTVEPGAIAHCDELGHNDRLGFSFPRK